MAWLDYNTYTALGYAAVPQGEFGRLCAKAQATVNYYTRGAVNAAPLTETQRRGMAELTELMYTHSTGETRPGPVSGFSNGQYSESYAVAVPKSPDEAVLALIELYFSKEIAAARVLIP